MYLYIYRLHNTVAIYTIISHLFFIFCISVIPGLTLSHSVSTFEIAAEEGSIREAKPLEKGSFPATLRTAYTYIRPGFVATDWIDKCVILDAEAQLLSTKQTIHEISKSLGFHPSPFSGSISNG